MKNYLLISFTLLLLFSASICLGEMTREETLVIDLSSTPISMDPHYKNITPNLIISNHIYSKLFDYKPNEEITGDLAEGYSLIDSKTWVISLRENIYFHDGGVFNADDVVATFDRLLKKNPESDYSHFLRSIEKYTKLNNYSVEIKTKEDDPNLIHKLVKIYIVSKADSLKEIGQIGKNKISYGTGPFQMENNLSKKNTILLKRNDNYYKKNSDWKWLKFFFHKNKERSIKKLIDGSVDIIEKISIENIKKLQKKDRYNFIYGPGKRLIFLYMDSHRDNSPYVKNINGGGIKNPLKNPLVRKAISMAINRKKICDEILNGAGEPTLQYVNKSLIGYNNSIPSDHFDAKKAREILVESGYKDGFKLTLHGPNNRYIKDDAVLNAVSDMLKEIGIDSSVTTLKKKDYFKNVDRFNYSVGLIGWKNTRNSLFNMIEPLMITHNELERRGLQNFGHYSNKSVDENIEFARKKFDNNQLVKHAKFAADILYSENAIIPLHFEKPLWATKKNIKILPVTTTNDTFALNFSKVK